MSKKAPWVKWYPDQFLGGIAGLTAEEIGVYSFVLNMIYDRGGPVPFSLERIAARVRMRPTSLQRVLRSLQDQGKIFIGDDGAISNQRAVQEIESRSKVLEKWTENLSGRDTKVDGNSNRNNGITSPSGAAPAASSGVETKNKIQKERKNIRPAKPQDGAYPEEFEVLWKAYPRTKNTSKKKAHDLWRMLNEENRARVAAAVPVFAAAMRAEGRPEDKIKHFQTFLNDRTYETVGTPGTQQKQQIAAEDWHKTATREHWVKVLKIYSGTSDWRESWGPAPGKPGCSVPADLIETLPFYLQPEVSRNVTPAPQSHPQLHH